MPISKVASEAPWFYEAGRLNDCHDTNTNLGAIRDAQGYFIAEICPGVENRAGEDCTAANIRLLTNAPELLAALQDLVEEIEQGVPGNQLVALRRVQARAVIRLTTEGD